MHQEMTMIMMLFTVAFLMGMVRIIIIMTKTLMFMINKKKKTRVV